MPKWLNKAAALSVCSALALVACGGDSPVVSTGRGGERGVAIPDAKLHAALARALGSERQRDERLESIFNDQCISRCFAFLQVTYAIAPLDRTESRPIQRTGPPSRARRS